VAHELNNPLQSIVGYTELLMRTSSRARVCGWDLEEIRFAAHRAAKIVPESCSPFVPPLIGGTHAENLNAIVSRTDALRQYELAHDGSCAGERATARICRW
jgi:two-component system NtrC family sensor kinase